VKSTGFPRVCLLLSRPDESGYSISRATPAGQALLRPGRWWLATLACIPAAGTSGRPPPPAELGAATTITSATQPPRDRAQPPAELPPNSITEPPGEDAGSVPRTVCAIAVRLRPEGGVRGES